MSKTGTAPFSSGPHSAEKGHFSQMQGSQRLLGHGVVSEPQGKRGLTWERDSRERAGGRQKAGEEAHQYCRGRDQGSARQIQTPCRLWEVGLALRWHMVKGHTL